MERLVVLPPVKSRVRTALLNLADFKDIPTEQLKQLARQLPGGSRVHLPDRVTTILGASPGTVSTRLTDVVIKCLSARGASS
jgi:hypothetical protein